jgi:aspartyl aminopeptidase
MIETEVRELLSFIDGNPTAYHTTASVREILLKAGFSELLESGKWQLEPGRDYFVCRNGSSIIAFRMGTRLERYSFNVAAAHTDSPCFRIKENAELHMGQKHTRLNTEGYGGMICSTWLDRPLSVAGRVLVKDGDAITSRLVALDRDLLLIPSVAIHMNREVNDKASFNKQIDMLPLLGGAAEEGVLKKLIAAELNVAEDQILGSDLFLCIREKATVWGCNEEFISSGRLDDQQCVFGILKGLLQGRSAESINVAAFFDNEEVGSGTKQGAASTFLYDVLHRIAQSLGGNDEDFHRAVASSFMVSADNAHAVHPNHPEHTDVNNCTYMNEGVVVKVHAGQKYTSDGMSMAVAKELAARAGVPLQYFANRSDKAGGSTLGNLAMAQVSMNCVDIGLPQLAMHSCYETAGAKDTLSLIRLMKEFYSSHFEETGFGTLAVHKA